MAELTRAHATAELAEWMLATMFQTLNYGLGHFRKPDTILHLTHPEKITSG